MRVPDNTVFLNFRHRVGPVEMPSGLTILALDLEGSCPRDVKVIEDLIRSRSPKDGDSGRSGAHSGIELVWGPEGDIPAPMARSACLKSSLGEGCDKRGDGEDIQVRECKCFALLKFSGWGVFGCTVGFVC